MLARIFDEQTWLPFGFGFDTVGFVVARQRCDCLRIPGSLSVLLAQKYHLRTGTEQIGGAVCVGREPCVELDEKSEERRDVGLLNLTESAGEVGLQQSFSWGGGGGLKKQSHCRTTQKL